MSTLQLGEEGFRWFIGIVEDVADPLTLGRVRVRIINEHDENVQTEDIDWATVLVPTTSAAADGVGETPSLTPGTRVIGFFFDGQEKQMPMILAALPTIPDNNENRHSMSWLARGKNTITKTTLGPEPESAYAAQYPYNKTITSKSGHVIELDDTPENERVHIYHKSGTYFEINKDGRYVIKSADDSFEVVGNNKQMYVQGTLNIEVIGNATIKAPTVTIDSPETKMTGNLTVDGNAHVKGNVSTDGKVDASGEVTGRGIKLSTHRHGGVQSGGSTTSTPV